MGVVMAGTDEDREIADDICESMMERVEVGLPRGVGVVILVAANGVLSCGGNMSSRDTLRALQQMVKRLVDEEQVS